MCQTAGFKRPCTDGGIAATNLCSLNAAYATSPTQRWISNRALFAHLFLALRTPCAHQRGAPYAPGRRARLRLGAGRLEQARTACSFYCEQLIGKVSGAFST